MKKTWTIFFLLICEICYGQNLIQNGDFEAYSSCPTNQGQLFLSAPWINPSVIGGSPDYYNSCDLSGMISVPNNVVGFQQAHSGMGYSGGYLWISSPPSAREYFEIQLTSTLTSNICYHLEMYINLGNTCQYTTDDIGVYFSDTMIGGIPNYNPLPFIPQVNNVSGNSFDTLNWTLGSGNYTAIGGENYILIGNFKNDTSTNKILYNPNVIGTYIYCYIDDVSLETCEVNATNNYSIEPSINIFPNPLNDKLMINVYNSANTEITIYDLSSRKIFQQTFTHSTTISTEHFAKGIYLYEVRDKNGTIKKGKVIKE